MFSLKKSIIYLVAFLFLLPLTWAAADDMNVVANQANKEKSQKWLDVLQQNEISTSFVVPADIDKVKKQKFIAIIGGVDDEAVKKLVAEVVGAGDAEAMTKKGAKKMYVKEGVWAPDQRVLVFTGCDTEAAAQARVESRDTWMPLLEEWFELGEGPGSLKAY